MSRSNKTNTTSTVAVHMEADIRQVVDQTMMNFGLENRSATICLIIGSWASAFPENTMAYEVARQSTGEIRKHLFGRLAEFFENEVRLLKGTK